MASAIGALVLMLGLKYDSQQVLALFAQAARDATNLDVLTEELVWVVDRSVLSDPVSIGLLL